MTTPAKLFGKNLGAYDEVDVDELLAQLSAEEIKILAKEVDPDVSWFTIVNVIYKFMDISITHAIQWRIDDLHVVCVG